MKNSSERNVKRRSESGGAIVEIALLSPWIFFLFVGVFDLGFYAYGAICTQNAARAGAVQTAAGPGAAYQSNTLACNAALNELNLMPNVMGVTSCAALPVIVKQLTLCFPNAVPGVTCTGPTNCADCGGHPKSASSQVSVTYQSGRFIPIPGILTNQLTITRIAEARIILE